MAKSNILLLCMSCVPVVAQTTTATTVRVTNEVAPPGGIAQVKVLLTSPKPITIGNMTVDFSGSFDSIDGIALFSNTGDVVGTAVVGSNNFNVQFTSPNGTFGSNTDYPLMTAAFRLSSGVVPGQFFQVNLNSAASLLQTSTGGTFPTEIQQGSITVGGSVNITDVIPGGGTLPAGATIRVLGTGFSPLTKLSVRGLATQSIAYVSPTEFQVTLREASMLDGALFQIQNPDNSTDNYYSYMRGVPMGATAQPLLAKAVPIFSILTATEAALPSTISPQVNPAYFTAIALQNPSPGTASVTIDARSSAGAVLGSTTIALPNHSKFVREASELFGFTLPTGAYLHVLSDQPVQVEGLLGCNTNNTVQPLVAAILAGPPAPVAPPPTTSGGGGGGSGSGGSGGGSGSSGGGGTSGGGGGGAGSGTGTP
jgi:uncharacterized membrane protein YgcG